MEYTIQDYDASELMSQSVRESSIKLTEQEIEKELETELENSCYMVPIMLQNSFITDQNSQISSQRSNDSRCESLNMTGSFASMANNSEVDDRSAQMVQWIKQKMHLPLGSSNHLYLLPQLQFNYNT